MLSLQDQIARELPYLRAQAESRMRDTFEIRRPRVVYDPVEHVEKIELDYLFTTKARASASSRGIQGSVTEPEVGGRTAVNVVRNLHMPISMPPVQAHDIAVCIAIDIDTDASMLGIQLRITGPAPGSQNTARRLEVDEWQT